VATILGLQLEAQVQAQLAAARLRRQRQARERMLKRLAVAGAFVFGLMWLVVGVIYAGAADRIASGVHVAGVDVGGMTQASAQRELERRGAALARVPLPVRVGDRTFRLQPGRLGVRPDWAGGAQSAKERGDGFGPIRGFRRIYMRAFGTGVTPAAQVDRSRLEAVVARIAGAVDHHHRDAALRLRGLRPIVVPGRAGVFLDRRAAEQRIVASISSLSRDPVVLPIRTDPPKVTSATLAPALAQAKVALSAPVRLTVGPTRYRVPRWRIAKILEFPAYGARALRLRGPGADAFFRQLQKQVNAPPKDARFAVLAGGRIRIVPSVEGRTVEVPLTAKALLAAALSPAKRVVPIAVATAQPKRTTAEAQAMGIKETVSSYETFFGGVANRIHNVQLVAHLIDDTLIPPNQTFSFNGTTGDRNAEKGFLEAPVIINGELQTGLGGGVCQVSTTVFNTAYEAGLKITARTNHALYISHYPQGRDATVNYPDTDLRFVNDTGHWLLMRTWVSSSSLTVALYGTSPHRRVESETAPLRVTAEPRVKRVKDPTLLKGKQVVDEAGSPSLATSVHRRVFTPDGTLLYDNVWYSSYRGETKVIRVGTKPKPKPKKSDLTKTAAQTASVPH
jgi:vancomycin resistance protein YoaR